MALPEFLSRSVAIPFLLLLCKGKNRQNQWRVKYWEIIANNLKQSRLDSRLFNSRREYQGGDVPVDDGKPKMRQFEGLRFDIGGSADGKAGRSDASGH
jgi:hypothetical protein